MKFSLHRRSRIVHGVFLKTFLRITKLIALILITACLQVSAFTYGQTITLSVHDATLENVFNKIKAQSEYRFWYESKLLNQTKKVTIEVKNASIKQVMNLCLANQPLTYNIIKKVIVIKPKNTTPDIILPTSLPKDTLHGKIINEQGDPVPGATIRINGTQIATISDDNGNFRLENVPENGTLIISSIGYAPKEYTPTSSNNIAITLATSIASLDSLAVTVSTGYQQIPKERATGSFVQIDNKLINRSVSTNILDRIRGVSSGILFNDNIANTEINTSGWSPHNLGISIRGQSTINADINPLIVVDNFPYEGDIRNINPNDIESITILKDAAAASIWGARSGNGVIVITTKKGHLNQKLKVEFNSSITFIDKPDLKYDRNFMSSSDYIEVEEYLFNQGFFDSDLTNTSSFPAVSPAVEILSAMKNGSISNEQANKQLNALKKIDVRDDIGKYVYQQGVHQQYSVGMRGGTNDMTYQLSVGYDQNRDNLIRNGKKRITISSQNTYNPIRNLELTAAINYSQNTENINNEYDYSRGVNYSIENSKYNAVSIIPYLKLVDNNGNPISITHTYRQSYIDETQTNNFLDWKYRPLEEIAKANNFNKINDLLLRASAKYKFLPFLNGVVQYQYERQNIETRKNHSKSSYYTRNLINQFLEYDESTGETSYIIPQGEILDWDNYNWESFNLRAQLNYNQTFQKSQITALAGAEIRQRKTTGFEWGSYGYDPKFGTGSSSFNYDDFYPTNPSGFARIPSFSGGSNYRALYRYISYYLNTAYTYDDKYTLSISGRKDGSNIFGAKTNDKITPLWSVGGAWLLYKESFYNISWLPYLKLRVTYGYNGNVYNGSAYLTGSYSTNYFSGLSYININNAPNPELRWEKVKNINIGIDFSMLDNRLNGTVELYQKTGLDLLEPTPLASQTGFITYIGNTAETKTNGMDMSLHSQNLIHKFKWNTTLLLSLMRDRLTKYEVPQTSTSIQNYTTGITGKPLHSIYSYDWAGLEASDGDPQGYVDGKVSKDYAAIISDYEPTDLVFNGSAVPTIYGAIRNDFTFNGFSLSLNIIYKLGYFFRIGSVNPNYAEILQRGPNIDYNNRWQKEGDEKHTHVPSLVYPTNTNRATFYKYSDVLVESADNIRLQDIRFGYDLTEKVLKNETFGALTVFLYAKNIGLHWFNNNNDIDPEYYSTSGHALLAPFSLSFGITANF